MHPPEPALKKLSKIALAALGLLFTMSIVYYKERLFFADGSYIAFNIINNKHLFVQEQRYGSFITQVVPLLCVKLHLPLKVALKAYALSFNLFYFLVAAFLVYGIKQYRLAILMALYYFLFVSASYFWPNNEIHQAVAWMFLLLGVTLYLGNKKVSIPALLIPFILLAFLTIYTHFIVTIPLGFLWVYLWIENKQWPFTKSRSILLSAILLSIFVAKYALTPAQSYDNDHLHHITHLSLQDIIDSFSTPWVTMFFSRCLTNYWIGLILLIGGLISLFLKKEKKLFILVILSFVCYIIIIGLTYAGLPDYYYTMYLFHIESEWVCISIIVAAPFVFSWLPRMKFPIAACFLVLIFIVRTWYIYSYAPMFVWRTLFKKQVFAQMKKKGITKLGIVSEYNLMSRYMLDWALEQETLLMSATNGDRPALTFCFINTKDQSSMERISDPKGFYNCFATIPPSGLDSNYFSIDTTQPYRIMTYEDLMK